MLQSKVKEFQKIKRAVLRKIPTAHTTYHNGVYKVVDSSGKYVVSTELMLPDAQTVREAWEYAKYSIWFESMLHKSTVAFDEDRMYRNWSKRREQQSDYKNDKLTGF